MGLFSLTNMVIIVLLAAFIFMDAHGVMERQEQTVVGGLLPFSFAHE